MKKIFFDNWESLLRTGIITILAYILLIVLLRSFGKRTLSKMNAFDFIVTVALGSTLASLILNKNVSLADGVLGFFLLIFLQFVITWFSSRFSKVSHLVKSTPTLLVYNGQLLTDMMKHERIAEDEIYAIIRESGIGSLKEVNAIVLETDGSMTVLKDMQSLNTEVMKHVRKPEKLQQKQ